jgi:hypothetical protein
MTARTAGSTGHLRRAVMVTAAVAVGFFGISACSVINTVTTAVHDIQGNKAIVDAFTTKLQSGAPTTFAATYVTTGGSPATIVYAVQPPNGVAFDDAPSGGSGDSTTVHLVANSSGEFACSPASSQWTCQKLGTASVATENQIFDLYTPAHWVGFLRDFSLAAGFAGDQVTTSSMTVNGFAMSCVDFVAPGVTGTSTICSTSQGLLGYVNVASDLTSFEIQSYSASPPASLFELPPGATVTTAPEGSS